MRQVVSNSGKNGQEIIDIFTEKYNSDFRMGYDLRTGMNFNLLLYF
jgi:hypothetical protein